MPEETAGGQTTTTTTQTASDASKNGKTGEEGTTTPSTLDIEKLSEEDKNKALEFAFKHPRFKELTDAQKELKRLQAEQKTKEDETLKEQNKWKELYEKEKLEKEQVLTARQQDRVDDKIKDEARKLNAADPDAVLKLIDRSSVKYNEDGTITGVEEAVKKLLDEKTYLKGTGSTTTKIGDGTNPTDDAQAAKRFKASQLKDPKFFRANEADIMKAIKLGLIDDDTA